MLTCIPISSSTENVAKTVIERVWMRLFKGESEEGSKAQKLRPHTALPEPWRKG